MDPYDTEQDSLTLQEMIDCDIRTSFEGVLRNAEYSQQVSGLELSNSPLDNFDNMGCDSGGGSMTAWFPGSQQSHFGLDFDSSAGGVLVNPQAVMPQPQQINIQNVNIVCTAASPMFVGHQSVVSPAQTLLGPEISEGLRFSMDGRHPHNNPKAAVDRPKTQANGARDHEKMYPKPAYSYSCLIAMALKNSKTGSLPVSEIYSFMTENFPYFKTAPNGWKNSVRHNLSLNKCFEKIEKPAGNSSQRKGCLWAMNPAKVEKMEEEVQKWSRKDPLAIKRSMANPEKLELLEKGCLRHELALKQESIKQGTKDSKNSDSIYTFKSQIKLEPLDSDLDLLESNLPLDTSLPDLNLQTGIWDELNDHRLNFGTGDSSSASPSSALSAGSPMEIVTPTSLHSNYVYTQSLTLNNNDNNTADNNNSQATLNSNYLGKNCKSVPALI